MSTAPSTLPDQLRARFDYLSAISFGYAAGLGILSGVWGGVTLWPLGALWIAFTLLMLVRWGLYARFLRAVVETDAQWRRWMACENACAIVAGVLWGSAGWALYQHEDMLKHVGLIVVIYVYCVAAIPVFARQPRMYFTYACLCFVPMVVRIASDGTSYGSKLAAILLVVLGTSILLARNYQQALQRVIELKSKADGLLVQLREEKQIAEAARRDAEIANRAKTQFFAAASHDLRQPLHAMGLFAEALRERVRDQDVAPLVNSINESVDALEGLFCELLDMTRIDAGGVEVAPEHFVVGDVLRKLRLHFEPTAFEKDLELRWHGASHVAYADPLLVERILRNLLSNAIRYTQSGAVMVSCRRRGERLQLQVWDTGIGICADEQSKIFDEFYQVAAHDRPAAHQRKGLGLGLSIVRRLAELMQAPLTVRSVLGRGSVFTLEVPMGRVARTAIAKPASSLPQAITLTGRRMVVIEDEPSVRTGLEALLHSWGAHVDSFASVAACRTWLAQDVALPTPDLAIVDYRLDDVLTGVDAIGVLRQRFGDALPAIVVTGSTMTSHEQEAQAHDFHVLLKPVVPNKLRAMISFKLKASKPRKAA